ncbi:hypothetical protein, partial [Cellulosimicrobium funkei]|uniref:hypothetical protein n=1 Tax=Cellulosimicrobium funkei TaxID=264251 RepID=UPI0030F5AF0C
MTVTLPGPAVRPSRGCGVAGGTLPDDATRLDVPGVPTAAAEPAAAGPPRGPARRAGAGLDGLTVADV